MTEEEKHADLEALERNGEIFESSQKEQSICHAEFHTNQATIRAALTTQKPLVSYLSQSKCGIHNSYNAFRKTDLGSVQVFCPECEIAAQQQPDVNKELLEAIKDLQEHWDCDVEDCPDDESIGWKGGEELPTTFGQIRRLKRAIARAEQKVVGE